MGISPVLLANSYQEQLITNGYMGMGQAIWFLCRDEHIHDYFDVRQITRILTHDHLTLSSIWREYFLVNFRWCLGLGILDRIPPSKRSCPNGQTFRAAGSSFMLQEWRTQMTQIVLGSVSGTTIRLKIIGPSQVEWNGMNMNELIQYY